MPVSGIIASLRLSKVLDDAEFCEEGRVLQSELARNLNISRATLWRHINRLEEISLYNRKPNRWSEHNRVGEVKQSFQ